MGDGRYSLAREGKKLMYDSSNINELTTTGEHSEIGLHVTLICSMLAG